VRDLKIIDKLTNHELLKNYDEIEWRGIKGIRDKLSHRYFDIDSEIIYDICETKLDQLSKLTQQMLLQVKNKT
jgi:uncharacterized protein with HEPN domain